MAPWWAPLPGVRLVLLSMRGTLAIFTLAIFTLVLLSMRGTLASGLALCAALGRANKVIDELPSPSVASSAESSGVVSELSGGAAERRDGAAGGCTNKLPTRPPAVSLLVSELCRSGAPHAERGTPRGSEALRGTPRASGTGGAREARGCSRSTCARLARSSGTIASSRHAAPRWSFRKVISFRVRVPVLSVSRYSMPPSSSGSVDESTCMP